MSATEEETVEETEEEQIRAAIAEAEEQDPSSDEDEEEEQTEASAEDEAEEAKKEDEGEEEKPPHASQWVKLRKATAKLKEREAAAEARVNQLAQQAADRLAPMQRMLDAVSNNDWDEFAKAIGEVKGEDVKSWNDLNKGVIRNFADPSYKEVSRLRKEQAAWRKQQEEQAAAQAQQAAEAQRAEAQRAYLSTLDAELKSSEDEVVKAAATNPQFAQAVFQEQSKAYDAASGQTITTEEAAGRAIKRLRAAYEDLQRVFGDRTPQTETRRPGAKTRRSTKTVSPRKAVQASPGGDVSDAENMRIAIREMRAALEEEAGV